MIVISNAKFAFVKILNVIILIFISIQLEAQQYTDRLNSTIVPKKYNDLFMGGPLFMNGNLPVAGNLGILNWNQGYNGQSYNNLIGNDFGFSLSNDLNENTGKIDTNKIQSLLSFAQLPNGCWLEFRNSFGGVQYIGKGIGQVKIGDQLYNKNSPGSPWPSNKKAGSEFISLLSGGVDSKQKIQLNIINSELSKAISETGGILRAIAWDTNGIVTDVHDFRLLSKGERWNQHVKRVEATKKEKIEKQIKKGPNPKHFLIDGYELTKYIKITEIPFFLDKLTEFKKFHKAGIYGNENGGINGKRENYEEDKIPGYILHEKKYYFNRIAIKMIHAYMSQFGYDYFNNNVINDLKWDDEIKVDCKKTFKYHETKKCPNCKGISGSADKSNQYITENRSRTIMKNCYVCNRDYDFTIWKGNGWKTISDKKIGWVKCSGCRGYGYTESYHLGRDVTKKNCNVSSCNNGWQECRKCFGKGQIKGTEYVKNVREVPGTVKKSDCKVCNNHGYLKTGKIIIKTCSSCDGKGYYFMKNPNPEWNQIRYYYSNSKRLYIDYFSKLVYGQRTQKGYARKEWLWFRFDRGVFFLGNKEYLNLDPTYSKQKYHDLDFVQIAFQRKPKHINQIQKVNPSMSTNEDKINFQGNTIDTIFNSDEVFSIQIRRNDTLFRFYSYYHENGKIKTKQPRIIRGTKQIAHGNWIWYNEDGQKTLEQNYLFGEKRSSVKFFNNGQMKYSGTYRNGKRYGNWKWYYENGNKKVEGNFNLNGKEEGVWIWYYENGQKKSSKDFGTGY